MRTLAIFVLAAAALVTYRSAILAAPDQTTRYPGQMTDARVWIQNRVDRGEAVPVLLESTGRDLSPIRVQVVNGDPNHPFTPRPVSVRPVSQTWEYKTIFVAENVDPAPALGKEGTAGWEFAGATWRSTNLTAWLMKRPR